jgi:hypothetical protein
MITLSAIPLTVVMMKLPGADRAFVDIKKLNDYCLSSRHPRGRHKARMFASLLGVTSDQADHLRSVILKAVLLEEAMIGKRDDFGQRYTVDFYMEGRAKRLLVRRAWTVRNSEDFPRFTSCYIL